VEQAPWPATTAFEPACPAVGVSAIKTRRLESRRCRPGARSTQPPPVSLWGRQKETTTLFTFKSRARWWGQSHRLPLYFSGL